MPAPASPTPPPAGRIDVHSHMLPAIDDGCESLEESLASIAMLKKAGYVGTICTPHVWVDTFPFNTPRSIAQWTRDLCDLLADRGVEYLIWPGGEVRLFDRIIDWFEAEGVPTLASSRCVLCDFWEPRWPKYVDRAFDWMFANGYQPILAHPERLSIPDLEKRLDGWRERGLLLQGNFRCMTGEDGLKADEQIRRWIPEGRYSLLAMDMHRPDALPSRLDGFRMVADEFGQALLDEMTIRAPRRIVFGDASVPGGIA